MHDSFTMSTRKQGRMKYLLLTIAPALLVTYLFTWLVSLGILPGGETFGLIYISISMGLMSVLGYYLIFLKNHALEITQREVHHKDWRGRTSVIPVSHFRGYRRNWLKEYILLDETGKTLFCVESNMENFDLFEQWIIEQKITRLD